MQTKQAIKPISLKTIGLLLLSNNSVTSNLSNEGKVITANHLKNKFSELKKLGDTPLIKLIPTDTGLTCLIPTLYRQGDEVVIVMPDINASVSNDFTVESWQAGDYNRAIIKHAETDINLSINVAYQNWFLEDIRVRSNNSVISDNVEKLNTQWLKDAPAIEHHLSKLPKNEVLTILGISNRRSEKYNTLLLDIQTKNGIVYRNVLTNSSLRSLIADEIEQFKITDIKPMSTKNQNSSKQQDRAHMKVFLEPVMNADLSDL